MKDDEIISKLNELLCYMEMRQDALSFADGKPCSWQWLCRSEESGEYTTFRIVKEHETLYQETCNAIFEKGSIKKNYTREDVYDECQTFLIDAKEKQKKITKGSFSKFFNKLNTAKRKKFFVFHKIYGLTIDDNEPINIGCFTLYNYPLHKEKLLEITPYRSIEELNEWQKEFAEHDNWIGVEIEGVDRGKAYELAYNKFEAFQGACQFILDLDEIRKCAVCILNDVPSTHDVCLMFCADSTSANGEVNYRRLSDININNLLYDKHLLFRSIIEHLSSIEKNEVTNRMENAFITYGRTIYEYAKSQKFIMFVTVVESLIEFDNPNLSKLIVRYLSAMLSDNQKTFEDIKNHYKLIYDQRSGISHGSSTMVTAEDLRFAKYYACELISCFVKDSEILNIKKNKDLKNYLEEKAEKFEKVNS